MSALTKHPDGIEIINGMRRKLSEKCKTGASNSTNLKYTYDILTGYFAVASLLNIISRKEYESATSTLYDYLVGKAHTLPEFTPIAKSIYAPDTQIREMLLNLKIELQEQLNANLARYRDPGIALREYSKKDIIAMNNLMLSFADEFNIIDKREYDMATRIMKEYSKGNTINEKIIFIPEAFYTKL